MPAFTYLIHISCFYIIHLDEKKNDKMGIRKPGERERDKEQKPKQSKRNESNRIQLDSLIGLCNSSIFLPYHFCALPILDATMPESNVISFSSLFGTHSILDE